MIAILLCATFFISCAAAICIFAVIYHIWTRSLDTITIRCTTSSIHNMISPPGATPHDLLISRAIPNARLIRAFALTNTFVSPDPHIHTAFVGHANALLRAATHRGWTHFQHLAVDAVDVALRGDASCTRDFDAFVQDVTLRIALIGLLGVDAAVGELGMEDISVVGSLITKLWSLSKKPEPIPPKLLSKLNEHLRRLMPDEETYPNPLDYVIPVWETLWRVVATAIAYARQKDQEAARKAFAELHRVPTMTEFRRAFFSDNGPEQRLSVEAFITETMRLHPPSKHIARATPFSFPFPFPVTFLPTYFQQHFVTTRRECADIETVLRAPDIWGQGSAADFDPMRFHPSRLEPEQERLRTLPFGCGRYRCVATAWAPMAAAVVAAAVLDRVREGEGWRIVCGPGEAVGGREGWRGWRVVKS
ncbi:hypothetical protein Hypma_013629 [Hypsizygus marmoreus]|uniref:Cytochrome P450 n=1 Tax=Hypsizygus marmoreus TaxID=39966 RepID=A0A369JGE8_HYPMA|nr:hypothetical protein Hypma_013629 [Hypsizygus marmoreus]